MLYASGVVLIVNSFSYNIYNLNCNFCKVLTDLLLVILMSKIIVAAKIGHVGIL